MKARLNPSEFPRLTELRYEAGDLSDYYFDIQDNNAIQMKHIGEIESDLQGLDDSAWSVFKLDLVPLVMRRDRKRGWQPLLDKLNEAKGYNRLRKIGCTQVAFIPRSSSRTPDLKAQLGLRPVLCEVKTMNPSDVEVQCRNDGGVRSIVTHLRGGFFDKLTAALEAAQQQITTYCSDPETVKIAFVVINYDDILHEYATNYSEQLISFIAKAPIPGLRIEFDIKPPFYWATA